MFLLFTANSINAQVAINQTGADPDSSAVLDISSTTRGLLIPRMTSIEKNQILCPAISLLVYDNVQNVFCYWDGSKWESISTISKSGNYSLYQVTIDIPQLNNGEHWEMILDVPGVTTWSSISVTAVGEIDDSDGDVIVSWRIVGPNQIAVKFSNVSNHKNSNACCIVLNIGITN